MRVVLVFLLLLSAAFAFKPTESFAELVNKYANAEWRGEYLSLLEVQQDTTANTGTDSTANTGTDSTANTGTDTTANTNTGTDTTANTNTGTDTTANTGSDNTALNNAATNSQTSGMLGTNPTTGDSAQNAANQIQGSTGATAVGACEVCVFVIENKEQHQPYLCRGLKDPNYQCVEVLESLMWWLSNEVYWLNYGCQRSAGGAVEWVRPCPAHAVCSWIEHLYNRTPFCPADPFYQKPQ